MYEQGHQLQSVPMGRDNIITIARPKTDQFIRQPLSIQTDTTTFNNQFRSLGTILQHCKRALLSMQRPDGTVKRFPEDEFTLQYGKPSLWKTWFEMAKFAEYKIQSESFLNKDTDDWSIYSDKMREWSLGQGHLHLADPAFDELAAFKPTGK